MDDVARGCFWAMVAIVPAAVAGFSVIYYMASHELAMQTAALAASVIRLLLAAAGSAIIIHYVTVPAIWFLVWMGLFYLATLVAEVYYAISIMSKQEK